MDYCSNCGAELRQAANFCSNCGAARAAVEGAQAEVFEPAPPVIKPAPPAANADQPVRLRNIENHLVKSIVATLCCCVPFGVVGIVYAAKADAMLRRGDRAAAEEAGKKAGIWSNLAIGEGVVVNLLAAVLTFVYQIKEGAL